MNALKAVTARSNIPVLALGGITSSNFRQTLAAGAEGISVCPETAVCLDTIERLKAMGQIKPGDEVVIFNTGAAQKYLEAVPLSLPRLDKDRPMKLD